MESLKKHVEIATEMYNKKLKLNLIKEYDIDILKNCCDKIEEVKIKKELYEDCEIIQKEMILDTNATEYLIKLNLAGIDIVKIKDFITVIQNNKDRLTNYKVEELIKVLKDTRMYDMISYAYLKYFIDKIKSNLGKRIVIENLRYFFTQNNIRLQDLTVDEMNLFTSPILSNYNLIPRLHIKRVYELLVENNELKQFILFLYLNKLTIPLRIEHYEKITKEAKQIHKYIMEFSKIIDNETLYILLLRWIENGCNSYDLKIIESKIVNNSNIALEGIVSNRSGYINFIFGNKISNLNLEYIEEKKEPLLIYAISNNKKGFLKLIQQNQEDFLNIPSSSILYNENFYIKYVNINTLNSKDLKELRFMNNKINDISLLQEGLYTFNEIKTLYNSANKSCYKLYNYLLELKIDDRILRMKQLINRNLVNLSMTEDEIHSLAKKIQIKSLYNWIEEDFRNIKDIKTNDAVNLLISYDDVKKFVDEINDRTELLYILRNKEVLNEYNTLQDFKNNIEKIDKYWEKLVKIMDFKHEFIEENRDNIKKFLLNNGAELAFTYYENCLNEKMKKSYKLIVKAELMGEFKKLKYHTDDLKRELNFDLDKFQIDEWINSNMFITNGEIEVGEYDDFYNTMILGEEPMRTCLSYKSGMYNKCLLACFDSNKKILYAKFNGKIVARAMVRLTKGTYQNINEMQSLSFIDVENLNEIIESKNEILTIFLERAYISGISSSLANKIEKIFLDILQKKASKMKALLVLSNFYTEIAKEDFVSTRYYMYISKSKSSSQYLDSLSGQATVSEEGQYKSNRFLIWNQIKEE